MASCFYPKVDKHGKSVNRVEDGKIQRLASILNVKTDRNGHSIHKEQIHHVGTETGGKLGRSQSLAGNSPLRPSTSLVDHIQSISQRFPSSINPFNHGRRASETTEEVAADGGSFRKIFQGGSFRKLVSRRSADDRSTAPLAAPPDDKKHHNLQSGPSSEVDDKNWAVFLTPEDVDNMNEIEKVESLLPQGAPKPPHPILAGPKKGPGSKDPSHVLAQQKVNEFPGSLENPLFNPESDFSIQTNSVKSQHKSTFWNHSGAPITKKKADRERTRPSEPKSDWERVLERTLAQMNGGRPLTSEIEEEKAEKPDHEVVKLAHNSQPVADWKDTSLPVHHGYRTSITEIKEEKVDKPAHEAVTLAHNSQPVADSQNTSFPMHHCRTAITEIEEEKVDKPNHEVVELAQNSQPVADWQNTSRPVQHGRTSIAEIEEEKVDKPNHEVVELTQNSQPVADNWQNVFRPVQHGPEHGRTSVAEIEEEKVDKPNHEIVELAQNSQPVADNWQNTSRPVHHSRTLITAIEDEVKADKRDAHWATLSQRVALWVWRSRSSGQSKAPVTEKEKSADKREEIAELAPNPQPLEVLQKEPILVDTSKTPGTEKEEENFHDSDEQGITVQSAPIAPPALALQSKLTDVNHTGVSATASGRFDDDHGTANMQSMPNYQPVTSPETDRPRLSSVSDNEAVARLWEQLDIMDDCEEKPQAAQEQAPAVEDEPLTTGKPKVVTAARSTTRVRRRRVRFSTCGGSDDFSVVDISATLLGKLSATKHHQVRYLQDELEQTRSKVAQLERDFQAQRDLKLAFKVQAVRLGAALKKLREFAQENGLDPRGVEGNTSPITLSPDGQQEVSQASDDKTKDIDSSPELILLKTQAAESGWLCDPKEVELQEQIGSGSTADIFKGVWHNLDVAVKCLRPDAFGGNLDAMYGFCQEVELLSRQRHPYVLRMFAACLSPPDHAWIITECLSSGTLTQWLHGTKTRKGNRIVPLPPLSERLRIAIEISMAMQYLHELSPKILHRDLKPSTVLLDENNHVRIADFNCARYVTAKDAALTGTCVYMAPEVMAHESYDEKCDIYSFAVILCELVTGTPPYSDTNYSPAEIACKVAEGTLRPTLPENHTKVLAELIKDAWEQKPRKRPSFSGITATLRVIAGDLPNVSERSM